LRDRQLVARFDQFLGAFELVDLEAEGGELCADRKE
jgi:hypothetical protein